MENTLENKAKFFAQYWGQTILSDTSHGFISDNEAENWHELFENNYLLLKPLSSLTPQEQGFLTSSKASNDPMLIAGDKIGNYFYGDIYITDYLRSAGYALPYMGLRVKRLIEYGWVKLC